MVRRDVKPENLLCMPSDDGIERVKLADFGSALLLPLGSDAAVDPVGQGTNLYLPPEVLLGKRCSHASDLWATGITTYVLISGNFPFGNTSDALRCRASFDAWDASTCGPGRARELVHALLEHEASDRPTAAEAALHTWVRSGEACAGCVSSRPAGVGKSAGVAPERIPCTPPPIEPPLSEGATPLLEGTDTALRECTSPSGPFTNLKASVNTPTKRREHAVQTHGSALPASDADATVGAARDAVMPAKKRLCSRRQRAGAGAGGLLRRCGGMAQGFGCHALVGQDAAD